jgi:hypothetical protein
MCETAEAQRESARVSVHDSLCPVLVSLRYVLCRHGWQVSANHAYARIAHLPIRLVSWTYADRCFYICTVVDLAVPAENCSLAALPALPPNAAWTSADGCNVAGGTVPQGTSCWPTAHLALLRQAAFRLLAIQLGAGSCCQTIL